MSVSKFFAPYCIKPIYLIDSQDKAGNCGFINGLFYSFILTITIVLAGLKFYTSETDETRRRYILYGMGISTVLLWVLCPTTLYYSYKTMWDGYDDSKTELQSQGYSKMEILNILQLFDQNSAPLNIGGLSGGMVFTKGQTHQDPPQGPKSLQSSQRQSSVMLLDREM